MDYTNEQMAVMGGMLLVYLLVCLIVTVVLIAAWWKIFKKAGQHGWAAIIPIYNAYVLFKISFGKASKFWMMLLSGVVGSIVYSLYTTSMASTGEGNVIYALVGAVFMLISAVISIMMLFKLSKSFGHGVGFGLGLWFLSPIFMCILGFGGSKYVGPAGVPAAAPAAQQ